MPLDKLTLHSIVSLLNGNNATVDKAIADKVVAIQQATVDLERARGARQYNDLVIQQVNNIIAELDKEEQAAIANVTAALTK